MADSIGEADILGTYPECPQREMALKALRYGHEDAARAWLDVLESMFGEAPVDLAG